MLCPSMLQHLVVFCFTSSVVLATYDTDVTTTSDQVSFPDSMINDLLKFKGIVRNLKVRRECQKQLANDVNKCQQVDLYGALFFLLTLSALAIRIRNRHPEKKLLVNEEHE